MMRRAALGLALGTLVTLRAGLAQSARKVARIGILGLRPTADLAGPDPRSPSAQSFLRGMSELGYTYGADFVTEVRGADGIPERLPGLAFELVREKVDVIVATGYSMQSLKHATSTIPIVMAAADDPVNSGFVQSLAHPGGNITGLSLGGSELHSKRLQLLKELVPGAAPVAVLWQGPIGVQAAASAAQVRGWKLLSFEVRSPGDIDAAFKAAGDARAGSLLVFASTPLFVHAQHVTDLAIKYRLPAMYELRRFVDVGGLMSYGVDDKDIWRHAASYVDKILKGAQPASLPIEQPTKLEFVVNLNAARALELTIPRSVLVHADEVIG
jgi:putative tryptophan/tyrosine transport system substrate-binding protein